MSLVVLGAGESWSADGSRSRTSPQRMHARPAFARLIAEELPAFGKRAHLVAD